MQQDPTKLPPGVSIVQYYRHESGQVFESVQELSDALPLLHFCKVYDEDTRALYAPGRIDAQDLGEWIIQNREQVQDLLDGRYPT